MTQRRIRSVLERAGIISRRSTPAEKKRAIAHEAAILFSTKGYGSSTMDELAVRLGVTKPFIYRYFGSKCSILEHIYQDLHETFREAIAGSLRQDAGPASQLRSLVRTYVSLSIRSHDMATVFIGEQKSLPTSIQVRLRKDCDLVAIAFRKLIERGVGEGVFYVQDAMISAEAMRDMVRWSYRRHNPLGGSDAERVADVLAELAVNAVVRCDLPIEQQTED
jgi:TetR/AcrR family transcriptional regulator, cholesterol catabolism regulator